MQTVYDWVTLAIFAGLVVLFLQRSVSEDRANDSMLAYLVGAVICAVTNYVGNEGYHLLATALIVGNLAFIFVVLKPIDLQRRS